MGEKQIIEIAKYDKANKLFKNCLEKQVKSHVNIRLCYFVAKIKN